MAVDQAHSLGTGKTGFINEHDLWRDEQAEAAVKVLREIETRNIQQVRVAWGDQHGIVRGKTLTSAAFASALRNGMDSNTGPLMLDTANAIVFNPFMTGGGLDLPGMTGCPDIVLVPDPLTFKVLPWTEGTGWVLSDMYFKDGTELPLSSRLVLRRQLDELARRGFEYIVGLEVEWYLTKLEDPMLKVEYIGGPGTPPEPPQVTPVQHGYQHMSEAHTDELDAILQILRTNFVELGLPLRTIEDEWGPGQLEFTFDPLPALEAADAMLLFRNATKQICRRHGYHATFMCRPVFPGFFSSGWHLHQSLIGSADKVNSFMPTDDTSPLSEVGQHFVGGLLEHAAAASVFTIPTVNGYRRLQPYSLAPDRVQWGADNRGAMVRVDSGPNDPASHIENRVGEPAANPYLYMASQIVSGLDGIDRGLDPGEMSDQPYEVDRPSLPRSLREALAALEQDATLRGQMGDVFVDYLVKLKESELGRFEAYLEQADVADPDAVTDWEHREYFSAY